VRLVPGTLELDALLDDGYLLEGALGASLDPSSHRIVLSIARAREVRGGHPTGRIYADLELVGELAPLLASITELSKATESIGIRDEADGQPRFSSVEAPWVRAKGMLRNRRRAV
jgi:hypothetical protein